MLRNKKKKTGSLLNFPGELKLKDVDDYAYLIKMLISNDERLIKNKQQKLANCLIQVKKRKENKDE